MAIRLLAYRNTVMGVITASGGLEASEDFSKYSLLRPKAPLGRFIEDYCGHYGELVDTLLIQNLQITE
jgi:hypothetical protein